MPSKKIYSEEQLELVRKLIAKEKCTRQMLHDLTGIPEGSMGLIAKSLGVKFVPSKGNMITNIKRARQLAVLKEKYAEELTKLFDKPAAVSH